MQNKGAKENRAVKHPKRMDLTVLRIILKSKEYERGQGKLSTSTSSAAQSLPPPPSSQAKVFTCHLPGGDSDTYTLKPPSQVAGQTENSQLAWILQTIALSRQDNKKPPSLTPSLTPSQGLAKVLVTCS